MIKRKHVFIILLLVVTATAGLILIEWRNDVKENQVCFKNNCFKVELAVTPEEQAKGLMFRENLEPDEGILFVFQEQGEYPFWMKNTKIPLDIIWIDKDKKVVFISENTLPCESEPCQSINPNKMAQYVLEVKGGTAQKIGLIVGDRLDVKISSPSK